MYGSEGKKLVASSSLSFLSLLFLLSLFPVFLLSLHQHKTKAATGSKFMLVEVMRTFVRDFGAHKGPHDLRHRKA